MTSSRFIFKEWCIKHALINTGEFSTGESFLGEYSAGKFPREEFDEGGFPTGEFEKGDFSRESSPSTIKDILTLESPNRKLN